VSQDIQNSIIEAIQIIAKERLKNVNFTKSYTGIVKTIDFENNKAMVEIFADNYECIVPHNLSSFIDKDDIVIVQDINNNKFKMVIQGVISSTNKDMFHIYDPVTDEIISSVLQLWDEDTKEVINVTFEIE
jgi:hypothetical protein